MCKTKIYRSGHLFWLVWLGQLPHNKPTFNAWMWSLVCQCSCPSVWRAWCPSHVAEELGTTLGMERLVQAVHTGLLGCICSSGFPTDMFSSCASTAAACLMFVLTPAKRPVPRKPNRNREKLGKQDRSLWQLSFLGWATGSSVEWVKPRSTLPKNAAAVPDLIEGLGVGKEDSRGFRAVTPQRNFVTVAETHVILFALCLESMFQGLFCRSSLYTKQVHYGIDFLLLDITWVSAGIHENVRMIIKD